MDTIAPGRIHRSPTHVADRCREIVRSAWNQRRLPGLALFDRAWGAATDSATGAVEVSLAAGVVTAVDTLTAGVAVPSDGIVLVLGKDAPVEQRRIATG